MTANSAVDFPEPDSPTSPTTSPAWIARLNSASAGIRRPPTRKLMLSPSISRSGSGIGQRGAQMEPVAQPFAEEIEADDRERDGEGRPEERPEGDADLLLRLVDHDAPIGERRLRAEAEIAEGGPAHQGEADIDARLDDDGRPDIGQNLAVLNVERPLAARLRRGDDAERDDRLRLPGTEPDDDEEREDESRNRQ